MKKFLLTTAFMLVASSAFPQQVSSSHALSQQEIVASCNLQVGSALTALGQSQQQIIALQSQVANLQKQIDDLKTKSMVKNRM